MGYNNNNPGNLRISNSAWLGKVKCATNNGFECFDTIQNGTRALIYNILQYYYKFNLQTVEKIISRWAPVEDNNNTAAYIDFVSKEMKIAKDQIFEVNIENIKALVRAIFIMENGNLIPDFDTIYLHAVNKLPEFYKVKLIKKKRKSYYPPSQS